ncbi:MAG TPA: ABC transporter substrate-binding protein [Kofleriaceae bacterium]|jgi:peptide/nickel transport system substrate-binding protein|nr:ABC transporter substrate-binding protein [Kofleriaceae bacterium]
MLGKRALLRGVVALACVGACGKSSKEGGGAASAKATTPEAEGPQRGGHIKLPSNEPRYTNPIIETRFDVAAGLIFEGLVGVDAKYDPVKRLAESWTISDDGKVITFKLRQGAVWQDGEKITSKDVAFTFDAVRRTTASTVWKGYMAPVANIETPDPQTVVVTYTEPYAPALITWTMPILPEHVYKGDLLQSPGNTAPIGSGPFKLVRWEPGKRMLLEANDKWWYGRANVDSIELVFGISDAEMLDALRRGQIDWAPIRNVDDWNSAQAGDFRADYEESDVLESVIRLIAWNTQKAPLDDKRVRQALTLAMNRPRVIDDVLLGQAQGLSGPFFPTMFGADPSIAPWPFDLDKAKKMLAEVTKGKRLPLDIIAIESQRGPIADQTFAIFKHDMETIGVDLKLELLPSREYFDRLAKRDYDGDYFGWLPDIPDPDPYALLHSSQIGVGPNYAAYANNDVDKLLDQARATTKKDDRKALYAKIHATVADELPYTPLYAPFGHYAWSRRLRGVNPRDLGPTMLFPGVARWWVTQKASSPGS